MPKTKGAFTPACGSCGAAAWGELDGAGLEESLGEALGDGLGPGEAQVQSMSSLQLGLTQRLVPATVRQRRSDSHWASELQVSKQAVGRGEGDGEALGDGLGLGEGLALGEGDGVTVKLTSQTLAVTSCTDGSCGEAVGRGRGVGLGTGCLSWKKSTAAVTSKMAVKPIKPQMSHFLSFIGLAPKRYKWLPLSRYKRGTGQTSCRFGLLSDYSLPRPNCLTAVGRFRYNCRH